MTATTQYILGGLGVSKPNRFFCLIKNYAPSMSSFPQHLRSTVPRNSKTAHLLISLVFSKHSLSPKILLLTRLTQYPFPFAPHYHLSPILLKSLKSSFNQKSSPSMFGKCNQGQRFRQNLWAHLQTSQSDISYIVLCVHCCYSRFVGNGAEPWSALASSR